MLKDVLEIGILRVEGSDGLPLGERPLIVVLRLHGLRLDANSGDHVNEVAGILELFLQPAILRAFAQRLFQDVHAQVQSRFMLRTAQSVLNHVRSFRSRPVQQVLDFRVVGNLFAQLFQGLNGIVEGLILQKMPRSRERLGFQPFQPFPAQVFADYGKQRLEPRFGADLGDGLFQLFLEFLVAASLKQAPRTGQLLFHEFTAFLCLPLPVRHSSEPLQISVFGIPCQAFIRLLEGGAIVVAVQGGVHLVDQCF